MSANTSTPAFDASSTNATLARIRGLCDEHPWLHHGRCSCCGYLGEYLIEARPLRETLRCAVCKASLRYRNQADALLSCYGDDESSVAELVELAAFASLSVYEPGISGPFRPLLKRTAKYTNSYFWPDVEPGQQRDNIRCENLEALTFADATFDLVVSSDILEHVRRPDHAFAEIYRILRPGGRHVFTVPMHWPFNGRSVRRVDVSGGEDRHLLPAVYHGSPLEPSGSLVYVDFGMDLPMRLVTHGFHVLVVHGFRDAVTIVALRPRE